MQPESARFVNLFPDELERSPPRLKLTAIGRVFVAFALAAGCSHSPPPPHRAAKPHEGLVLQVACPDQVCGAIVGRYAQAWAIESGAEVNTIRTRHRRPNCLETSGLFRPGGCRIGQPPENCRSCPRLIRHPILLTGGKKSCATGDISSSSGIRKRMHCR